MIGAGAAPPEMVEAGPSQAGLLQPSLAVEEPPGAIVPWVRLLGPALALLQLTVLAFEQAERAGRLTVLGAAFVLLRVGLTLSVLPLFLALARRARGGGGRGSRPLTAAAAAVIAGGSVLGALLSESCFYVVLHFTVWPDPRGFLAGYRTVPLSSLGLPTAVLLGVSALDHAWAVTHEANDLKTHAARMRGQAHQARLELLRSQLHPHFLFNSLNSVLVLARREPARAAEIMVRLESLFRRSLAHEAAPFTSLGEELEWIRDYLEVESCRFHDRLVVEISPETEAERGALPRLLLQPLLENALRHGVGSVPGRGEIRVRARRAGPLLVVSIENNGGFRPGPEGFGLRLTRRRLREAYGGGAWLTITSAADATLATVKLPWSEAASVAELAATMESSR